MIHGCGTVLVVGYNAFDTVIPFSGHPVPDAKHEVEFFVEGGGGPGATAAVALRRLGADVRLMTPSPNIPRLPTARLGVMLAIAVDWQRTEQ